MLESSPKKALLYELIDGKRNQIELCELLNQAYNLEGINSEINQNYIIQSFKEMEEDVFLKLMIDGSFLIALKLLEFDIYEFKEKQ